MPSPTTESTPLLADVEDNNAAAGSTSTPQPNGIAGRASSSSPRGPLSDVNRALLILHSISLGFSVTTLIFFGAVYGMNSYTSSRFGQMEWEIERDSASLFWSLMLVIVLNVINIVLVSTKGRFLPSIINIIPLGVIFIAILGITSTIMVDRVDEDFPIYCNPDLDSPDSWHSGSYAECVSYVSDYIIVSWFFLSFSLCSGLLALAIVIASLVKVYKERNNVRRLLGTGANAILRPGLFSVEVAIRWGPPSVEQQASGDDRQGDVCRHCQGHVDQAPAAQNAGQQDV